MIGVYKKISKQEINKDRISANGKHYNLNHDKELIVDMKFKGQDLKKENVNSQGWERSSSEYFKSLNEKHPEYFSKKNQVLIQNNKSPIVDKQFIEHFPQYKDFQNEKLIHHHVGGDGQAVAVPQSIHKGFGEIHNVEKNLGITKNGEEFSKKCERLCKNNNKNYNKNSSELRKELNRLETKNNISKENNNAKEELSVKKDNQSIDRNY